MSDNYFKNEGNINKVENLDLFGGNEQFDSSLTKTQTYLTNQAYEWEGMLEYDNVFQEGPEYSITLKFRNEKDFLKCKEEIRDKLYDGQVYLNGTQDKKFKQAWYPLREQPSDHVYISTNPKNPRFPIYIVSKGRYENNPTSRALMEMNVPFRVVVEEPEFDDYAKLVGEERLLVLPEKYKQEYDTFWDDKDGRVGPGAARNFAWDHSIGEGHDWHWVMDDNIGHFYRFNKNVRSPVKDGTLFYACEDFVLRYENIAQAGPNYTTFCPPAEGRPPIMMNTRIYSCLLIRNDMPYRWRGRYNEDTDLSLRMLKDGLCTVQFNFLLQGKMGTQQLKGGNTEEFYANEGTKNKSQMLEDMHPDVASVVYKFGRWHHHVDYTPFKNNKLKRKEGIIIPDSNDNYDIIKITKEEYGKRISTKANS
jgi:hypothetical protein